MSSITSIEADIKLRLEADLSSEGFDSLGCKVESFPDKPDVQTLKMLAAAGGAVVVRYVGSKYGGRRGGQQDRFPHFELMIISESLAASGRHLGGYKLLDLVIARIVGFVPPGCLSGAIVVSDSFIDQGFGVWQYAVTISVCDRIGTFFDNSIFVSNHVREQLIGRVLLLLSGVAPLVRRGSEPRLDPDLLPEVLVSFGNETHSPGDDALGMSMRVIPLEIKIYTQGDDQSQASTVLTKVESALFGDIHDGVLFAGLARSLSIGSVASQYNSGKADYLHCFGLAYFLTTATYEVAYLLEDGNAEIAQ